jgi:hypothetical protein
MSQLVNAEFIKQIIYFTLLYRDCINLYGWQKLAEADTSSEVGIRQRIMDLKSMHGNKEYCACNGAE